MKLTLMNGLTRLTQRWRSLPAIVGLVILLTPVAWPQASNPTQNPQSEKPTGAASPVKAPADDAAASTRISPKEAEELFRSVDEILHFVSKDTGLPIKREVKRQLTSREEVVAFIEKSLSEDEDAKRLQRSELVLKKFGFLPRDFDMKSFLVGLLREQIAGYYNPKTKTVNLLDWLGAEQQRPVLAHELTHALQDQSFDLTKWMKTKDLTDKRVATSEDIQKDEISTARQAVVEGQATAVLVDYMLAPVGRSIKTSPEIVAAMREAMLTGSESSVQLRSAPNFLREALTFPYRYGLDFTVALINAGGPERAFAGVFRNPPTTSRQIMEPNTYLSGERIEPMRVPDFNRLFKNYERFDVGAMGEFDVALLLHEYAGPDIARNFYPNWRGGYYYAARAKNDASAPLALLYVSRWANAERAAEFAAIYAKALNKRYKKVQAVGKNSAMLLDNASTLLTLSGRHEWMTEEGSIVLDVRDDTVMATEGLDPSTTEGIAKEIFPATR